MSKHSKPMMSGLLKLTLPALMLMSLQGCTTLSPLTPSTVIVSDFCSIARPITYSASQDSAETVSQIRSHNAAYLKVCPN